MMAAPSVVFAADVGVCAGLDLDDPMDNAECSARKRGLTAVGERLVDPWRGEEARETTPSRDECAGLDVSDQRDFIRCAARVRENSRRSVEKYLAEEERKKRMEQEEVKRVKEEAAEREKSRAEAELQEGIRTQRHMELAEDPKWFVPALSADICGARYLRKYAKDLIAKELKYARQGGGMVDKQELYDAQLELRRSDEWETKARAELKARKRKALPCSNNLVAFILQCTDVDGSWLEGDADCNTENADDFRRITAIASVSR
jgi:hypothetical protein